MREKAQQGLHDVLVFGGDLNLRDNEAKAALAKITPKTGRKMDVEKCQIKDAWEIAGSP